MLYYDFNGSPVYDKNPDLLPVSDGDSFLAKVGKGIVNTLGHGLDEASKFNDVVGARMRQVIFGDNSPYEKETNLSDLITSNYGVEKPNLTPTTGNKTIDTIGNIAGTIEGFVMPSGGGAPSFAGPVRQAAETVVSKIGGKALPGVVGKVVDKALVAPQNLFRIQLK